MDWLTGPIPNRAWQYKLIFATVRISMKNLAYILFGLKQVIKLVFIFNRREWYRHTEVFLLSLVYKYTKNNAHSTIRIFFLVRYPKMWKYYSPIIKLALEDGDASMMDALITGLSSKRKSLDITLEDHIYMLINIYHVFLFFGMCKKGLKFRSEARDLFVQSHESLSRNAKISHPLRLNGCLVELTSVKYSNSNVDTGKKWEIPNLLVRGLSGIQNKVTASLPIAFKKLLDRGVIIRGPSQIGEDYKKDYSGSVIVMNLKSNTIRSVSKSVPLIGYYNGEQFQYLKRTRNKVPKGLDYYCFPNEQYLPLAREMVSGDNVRSFELSYDWLFNGTSNALQNILFDLAMSSAIEVSVCYFDLMLSISRSPTHYPEEWGRADEKVLKEVIRRSCAASEDPISQFHFSRFIINYFKFDIDDQLRSVIEMTEQEFAENHEKMYSRNIQRNSALL